MWHNTIYINLKHVMFIPHSDIYIQKIYINPKRIGNQEKRSGNKK